LYIEDLSIIIIFIVLSVIGILRIVYNIFKTSNRKSDTSKYLERFSNWLKTPRGNFDTDTYTWLTQNAGRIQSELGKSGVATNYISPGTNYLFSNYPLIVNILPLIKNGVANEMEVTACEDALNRHIGNLKYARKKYFFRLLIPVFWWIIEGIKTIIILLFCSLLYWLGLYKYNKVVEAEKSIVFKLIIIIIAVINFGGVVMGIVVNWGDFCKIISEWIK